MRWLTPSAVLFAVPLTPIAAQDKFGPITPATIDHKDPVIYQKEIEPIFEEKCSYCHSGSLTEGKFDMGTHGALMKGGKSGKAIVEGNAEESLLYKLASRNGKPLMPPKSEDPLTPEELALIKLWIEQGAKPPTGVRERTKIVVGLPPALVKPVRAVAVRPDGTSVAASHGNQIFLFDPASGEQKKLLVDAELKTPEGEPAPVAHMALVDALAFSPDGKTLASGSFRELKLWDVENGLIKKTVSDFSDRVVTIDYSPDGKRIVTGGGAPTENGELRVFDENGTLIAENPTAHSDSIFGVEFSPDGKHIATCGADKFVKAWETEGLKFVKSFEGHTHHVLDVGWKGDGKLLASGGADNVVKIWDFEKGEQVRTVNAHNKQVTRLEFIGNTQMFLTVGGDQQLKMWNVDNGGNTRNFGGNANYLYAVDVSTDGKVVAAGGEEGVVRVYDQNAKVLQTIDPDAKK